MGTVQITSNFIPPYHVTAQQRFALISNQLDSDLMLFLIFVERAVIVEEIAVR